MEEALDIDMEEVEPAGEPAAAGAKPRVPRPRKTPAQVAELKAMFAGALSGAAARIRPRER